MHEKRFIQLLDYIDRHLGEELSVDRLSHQAGLSKFHFHRQFSAIFGIGISTYIRFIRLKKASYQLAYRLNTRVIDIALENGYESSEAFSRAFKQSYVQSPSSFRRRPDWEKWESIFKPISELRVLAQQQENPQFKVQIVEFEPVPVAIMDHCGPLVLLGDTIRAFIEWRKKNRLSPDRSRTFNLLYNDPEPMDDKGFRFGLCAEVFEEIKNLPENVYLSEIPAGICAVVRFKGIDDMIGEVARYLYSDWLSERQYTLRDFPLFLERIEFFPNVPEHEAVTDIYLPIQ